MNLKKKQAWAELAAFFQNFYEKQGNNMKPQSTQRNTLWSPQKIMMNE